MKSDELTKREYIAVQIMAAKLANPDQGGHAETIARSSVQTADLLLSVLEEKKK